MTAPAIRYPAGPITPHGAYYLIKGTHPELRLAAYDQSIVFSLMGGQAIPNRTMPEYVIVEDIKGLVPPWQTIDQKGATEDGVEFLDALYDPIEVDATVLIRGRDAKAARKTARDLIASIDAKQTSELSWFTQELGYWWAPIRWFKAPTDKLLGAQKRYQQLSLALRADNGFWRTFDDVDQFKLDYADITETFTAPTSNGLTGWDVGYFGDGGLIRCDGSQAILTTDPDRPILADGRDVVCRRTGYTTTGDNQIVEFTIGASPGLAFNAGAGNDGWCRLANTGTPGRDGVRLRVGLSRIRLSYFVNGVETVLREAPLAVQPMPGEKFALVCGYDSNPRMYKALRNGIDVQGMTVVEGGTGSAIGSGHRGVGFGVHGKASTAISPDMPAAVRKFTAGTHGTRTQSGFVWRLNIGDQPRYDRVTFFGPGTLSIADGPGSKNFVQFGPLLPNQVMQIRMRDNAVIDMTSTPPSPQEQILFEAAVADYASFATANNAGPLLASGASIFGVQPPQGNPFSLLSGRFSKASAISAKSPGLAAQRQAVAVKIDGGNADSAVLVTGTPLRRYPI